MPAFNAILTAQLEQYARLGRLRTLESSISADSRQMMRDDKMLINFSSNDYLGLRFHPHVVEAGKNALGDAGSGSGASRLVTGEHRYYAALENKLAEARNQEAALIFGSGYLANLGVISAMVSKDDLVISDKLAHASIIDGVRLSGATLKRFSHNNVAHAMQLLETYRRKFRHCLLITESIFSMEGDVAPLDALSALASRYDAWFMVDDAHRFDFIAPTPGKADIWIGTLSKALGSYGGYVAGSKTLIDYLLSSARSMIFSTALPPASIASASAALLLAQSESQRVEKIKNHTRNLCASLRLPASQSAIIPIIIGDESQALAASQALQDLGIYVQAIRPPTVPPRTSRLRVTINAAHSDADIELLMDALAAYRR